MTLNIAIQMDHPSGLAYYKDATYAIGLEAQKRGYNLFYYHPSSLNLRSGVLSADISPLTFYPDLQAPFTLGEPSRQNLEEFDLILMRQNFTEPRGYIAVTHMLDHLKGKTLVLNDPQGVRESPEKLLITHFPDLAPPTLITRNLEDIKAFQAEIGDIVIKPMNGFGGLDIYHLKTGDTNLLSVFDMMSRLHTEPFIIQKYLPEIRQGDKRIILIEGKPVAAFTRIPAADSAKANLHAGGQGIVCEITPHEIEMCARIEPEIQKRGLVFIGMDVIGSYITELNPKSPTGTQTIKQLTGFDSMPLLWDAFETRLSSFKQTKKNAAI